MNRNDLAERLAEEHELTKVFPRKLVDSVFEMITTAAQKGEEVALFGFGRFKVAERPARLLKTSLNAKRRATKGT
jgi:DNA-binding protein HU-beta